MAAKKVKVKDNPSLERDTASSAIINTNSDAYSARRLQIKLTKEKQILDAQQTEDINNLKNDVAEIKKMLQQLTGGK